MKAIAFDTLEFAKTLKEANFSNEQAEALARAVSGIVEEQLATKRDLKELELALRRDIKELETSLKRDMKELENSLRQDMKDMEYRLTIRLGGMLAAAVVIVAALVKLL